MLIIENTGLQSDGYYYLLFKIKGNNLNISTSMIYLGTKINDPDDGEIYCSIEELDSDNPYQEIELKENLLNDSNFSVNYNSEYGYLYISQEVSGTYFTVSGTREIALLKVKVKSELSPVFTGNVCIRPLDKVIGLSGYDYSSLKDNTGKALDFEISEEVELTNSVESSTYKVTYINSYGSAPASLTGVTKLPSQLPELTYDGYNFMGWYKDSSYNTKATPGETITSNIILYAKWELDSSSVVEYTITLELNGGTFDRSEITAIDGTVIDEEFIPTRSNYRFLGWYDENDNIIIFPYTIREDITFTAKWEKIEGDLDILSNKIIFEKSTANKFKIYIQNPNNLLIKKGIIRFNFDEKGTIKSFISSNVFETSFDLNQIDFGKSLGISNSYIYLGEVELEAVGIEPSVLVDIEELVYDIAAFSYNSITIEFENDPNSLYFYFEAENTNITTKQFKLKIYLHNPNRIKVYGFSYCIYLPDGISILSFTPNKFNLGGLSINFFSNDIIGRFKSDNDYMDDEEVFLGTILLQNESVNGSVVIGLLKDDELEFAKNELAYVIPKDGYYTDLPSDSISLNLEVSSEPLDNDTSLKIQLDNGEIIDITDTYTFESMTSSKTSVVLKVIVKETSTFSLDNKRYYFSGYERTVELKLGDSNETTIYVKAEDGTISQYKIYIPRQSLEQTEQIELEIKLNDSSKNYDKYYEGLIGFDIYVNNSTYDVSGVILYLNYSDKFELVKDKYEVKEGFSLIFGREGSIEIIGNNINSLEICLGRVYFRLKDNITVGNYDVTIDEEISYICFKYQNISDIEFINSGVLIGEGINPVIQGIKIVKHNTNIVISNITDITDQNGIITIPTISYIYSNIDIYIIVSSGITIKVNDQDYNNYYNLDFLENFTAYLNVILSVNDSFTQKSYTLSLTRDEGDSNSQLEIVYITINNIKTEVLFEGENGLFTATISNVRYTYRNNVSLETTKSSELQTVLIDGVERLTNTYTLSIGENIIEIKVTSQNGNVSTYTLTLELDDKVKAIVESDNIESLTKVFDNISITSSNIVINATLYGEELNDYDIVITFKDSTDRVIENVLNVGRYKVELYINDSSEYNRSELLTKYFEITILTVNSEDVLVSLSSDSYVYTGSIIKPTIDSVTLSSMSLLSSDYEVLYGDNTTNINVSENVAFVKISGKGNYSFEKTVKFNITQKSLKDSDITFSVSDITYKGTNIEITYDVVQALYNSINLTAEDYEIINGEYKEKGSYNVVFKGKNNYKDERTVSFNIISVEMTDENTKVVIVDNSIEYETNTYETTYTGSNITPEVRLYFNDNLVSTVNYEVIYSNNQNVGEAYILLRALSDKSLTGQIEGYVFKIKGLSIDTSKFTYDDIPDGTYTYNGLEHNPNLVLYYNLEPLTLNTDYRLEYTNNINAGQATITVLGIGNYLGRLEVHFNISKLDITSLLSFSLEYDVTKYNGYDRKPSISNISCGLFEITEDDINIIYNNNLNAGIASVIVSLKDEVNFTGSKESTFVINKINLSDENVSVVFGEREPENQEYIYTGNLNDPSFSIRFDSNTIPSREYTQRKPDGFTYDVGDKYIIVTANENSINFEGTLNVNYKIVPANIENITIEELSDVLFKGTSYDPQVLVKYNNKQLELDKDFTYEYLDSSNINVGTAKALFKGHGNFTGEKEFELFSIGINLSARYELTVDTQRFVYNGLSQKPSVKLTIDGVLLEELNNYTLNYPDDTLNVGVKTITLEGIGNLEGIEDLSVEYEIIALELSSSWITYTYTENYRYTASEIELTDLVIKLGENVLEKPRDYSLEYRNNINVGISTVTVKATIGGNYSGSKELTFNIVSAYDPSIDGDILIDVEAFIEQNNYTYIGSSIKPVVTVSINDVLALIDVDYSVTYEDDLINVGVKTITINGLNNILGYEKVLTYEIVAKDINDSDIDIENIIPQTYTGSVIIPNVVIRYNEILLVFDRDYLISSDAVEVGDHSLTISGTNNYTGEKTLEFKIIKVSSISATLNKNTYVYQGPDGIKPNSFVFKNGDEILTLEENVDYNLHYYNNINVSYDESGNVVENSSVEILFIGSYEGSVILKFKIIPLNISQDDRYYIHGEFEDSYSYSVSGVKPVVSLRETGSEIDIDSNNYDVNYYNYDKVSTELVKASVVISGKGNYQGSISKEYIIVKSVIDPSDINISFENEIYYYTGSIITPSYSISIDGNLVSVESSASYFTDEACENETSMINAGIYYVKVSFDTENMTSETVIEFRVSKVMLVNSFISESISVTYNGNEITLTNDDVTLMYLTNRLTLGNDYTLDYESKINVGSYNLLIKAIEDGNYTGSITTLYKIERSKISLKAHDKESPYLTDIVDLTYEIVEGTLYGDDNLEIEMTVTCNNRSYVGDYVINITGYNENYDITFVNGNYKITKADLDIRINNQLKRYTSTILMPTYEGILPSEVSIEFYLADTNTIFTGASEIGEYNLKAVFTSELGNYNIPEDIMFTFTIEMLQIVAIKEDSNMSFIALNKVKRGSRTLIYRKSYFELGYVHGTSDIEGNENGINHNMVVLGNIIQKTSVKSFLEQLEVDLTRVVVTNHNGVDIYKSDPTTLNSLQRRYVGTGWTVKLFTNTDYTYKTSTEEGYVAPTDVIYLSVLGDLNGNGNVDNIDMTKLSIEMNSSSENPDYLTLAMLIRNNGSITNFDLTFLSTIITGTSLASDYFNKVREEESSVLLEEMVSSDSNNYVEPLSLTLEDDLEEKEFIDIKDIVETTNEVPNENLEENIIDSSYDKNNMVSYFNKETLYVENKEDDDYPLGFKRNIQFIVKEMSLLEIEKNRRKLL